MQLEKKHVSMGQREQSCMQHDIFVEMSSQGIKENTTTDQEVEEGADYEVQRGTEWARGGR